LLSWTPWGLTGLAAGLSAWAAALFIARTAPDPQVRLRFSALLFLEGVMIMVSLAGPMLWLNSEAAFRFAALVHTGNDWLLIAAYLPAVSVVVDSPLLRSFRRGPGLLTVAVIGVGGAILNFAAPHLFVTGIVPAPPGFGATMLQVIGPGWNVTAGLLTASYTYGLVATILAWRRAETPISRRKAGTLALAFGVRDFFWGGMFLVLTFSVNDLSFGTLVFLLQAAAVALLCYVALTAYGVASSSLLDIDLRVKWTLARGTVAAVFIAVFFVVSEGAQTFLSESLGPWIGLLATGALVLLLAPLQRAGERFADAALPSVQDTPEYRSFRTLQIYGEALSDALQDGQVSPVERVILRRLANSLDLDPAVAAELEAEVAEMMGQ